MTFLRKTYIPLDQKISPQEQKNLEAALYETLNFTAPPEDFMVELEDALLAEAQDRHRQQHTLWHGLSRLGMISGALLSIVGSVWMWLHWQEHRSAENRFFPTPS